MQLVVEAGPLHKGEGTPSHTKSLLREHLGENVRSISRPAPEEVPTMKVLEAGALHEEM